MLRSKTIKYLFCTHFHLQSYYESKPRYDLKRLQQQSDRFFRMMHDAPQNVFQNEIANVRISFCCFGVRPIVLFVRCTLHFESTKYKSTNFIRIICTLRPTLTVRDIEGKRGVYVAHVNEGLSNCSW